MDAIPKVALLIDTSSGFGRGLLGGIARHCEAHGPWIVEPWVAFYVFTGALVDQLPKLRTGGFDGIISRGWDGAEDISALGVPCVICHDRHPPAERGVSGITTNDAAIGAMAAEYFLRQGYRSFAYLGYDFLYWSEGRRKSFIDCLRRERYSVAVFKQRSAKGRQLWDYEKPRVADWLRTLRKPVALFACNDERAVQAAAAYWLAGLQIPYEVAILGVDDDEFLCQFWHPSISSIRLNVEKAGYEAAALLDSLMKGKCGKGERIYVEPIQVSTRVSTDTVAVSDPAVAEAVRFIRANADRKIEVNDVARAVAVSRRWLYHRFKQQLGHTIYDEITAAHLAKIERLLVETRLPVSEIAYLVGFSTPEHISQFFRNHRKMTPSQFRKRHAPQ